MTAHPGITLRIRWRVPATGDLLDVLWADSDQLHLIARMGQSAPDGWYEVFPGEDMGFNGSRDLLVDIRPELLAEPLEDADEDTTPPRRRWRWRWRHTLCAGVIACTLTSAASLALSGHMPSVTWLWIMTIVMQSLNICLLRSMRERQAAR
ncbi:MAG TPA: hypothetical protein VGG25_11590 [Streptosporangiaceae bacterium]